MKKNKCDNIKTDDKSEENLIHESLENETLKSHENANVEYKYTSNNYCFGPARRLPKRFLKTTINTDDKTVRELMRELNELLESEKIRLQKIVNNENLYDDNSFTSDFRGSKVFKAHGHNKKI